MGQREDDDHQDDVGDDRIGDENFGEYCDNNVNDAFHLIGSY